jgi:hypothetical protein
VNSSKTEPDNSSSLTAYAKPAGTTFLVWAAYLLLGIVSLLMVSDFLLRGIFLAFEPGRTDFSEIYASAWLWRNGQNFYDPALATLTQQRLIGVSVPMAPIYPPSTFVLMSPFTLLPWRFANLVWLVLGFVGIGATIVLLWRLCVCDKWGLSMMAFGTFLLSFDPLHQAFHLGNVALLVVPLTLWAILLAERQEELLAGLGVGIAACLKPQIGIWVLVYYILRGRWRIFVSAIVVAAAFCAILLMRTGPSALFNEIPYYQANLRYWFDPGRPFSFTEGSFPYHVNMTQVILYPMLGSITATNVVARLLFAVGLSVWLFILWRARFQVPVALAIASLLALSFISMYHSVSDATVLTLALCWAVPHKSESWTSVKLATCFIFLLMMLPGHSALMRLSPHIAASITAAWWWKLFVARYFVWLLVSLNVALLVGMWEAQRNLFSGVESK